MELKKQKTYKAVYEFALNTLISSDYMRKCSDAGLKCSQEERGAYILVPYFDEIITLGLPKCTFESSKKANVTLVTKILLLHYVNNASGIPLTGEKVGYGDIPQCMHYEPVFEKRVLNPVRNAFGHDKYAFLQAGMELNGKEEGYGDASFTLFAFPQKPFSILPSQVICPSKISWSSQNLRYHGF